DLHLCGTPDLAWFERVLERCRRQEVDLVAVTGDLVDTVEHRRFLVPLLSELRGRVGSFAILGNHDQWHEPEKIRVELFREGPTVLHVCRGLSGQHPLRYNCRPEVARLVLRPEGGATPARPPSEG